MHEWEKEEGRYLRENKGSNNKKKDSYILLRIYFIFVLNMLIELIFNENKIRLTRICMLKICKNMMSPFFNLS